MRKSSERAGLLLIFIILGAVPAVASYIIPNGSVTPGKLAVKNGFTFTIVSASATAGWQYTNNGVNFTLISNVASATTAYLSGPGTPTASGTLTCVPSSGCVNNLSFSAFTVGAPNALLGGLAQAPSTGGYSTSSSSSCNQVTNQSVTLVTVGRPVTMVMAPVSSGGATAGVIGISGTGNLTCAFQFKRDGSDLADVSITNGSASTQISTPSFGLGALDQNGSSGSHTYTLCVKPATGATCSVTGAQLTAWEL